MANQWLRISLVWQTVVSTPYEFLDRLCADGEYADAATGSQGAEYPKRFFARDYAGNRLEFSL